MCRFLSCHPFQFRKIDFQAMASLNLWFAVIVLIPVTYECKKTNLLKASLELLAKESERIASSGTGCSLTNPSQESLDSSRVNQQFEKSIACHIKFLEVKGTEGWVWSSLGQVYLSQAATKATSLANTCFKQAAKLTGKISPYVSHWYFLGPFVIGKMEVDGDPVAALGGIQQLARLRWKKGVKYSSELVSNGETGWVVYKKSAKTEAVRMQPQVQWNDLINSLGSPAITEWQGWAVGEFAVNENNQNIVIQCLGVHTLYVNDIPVTGDVYRRDKFWFSVHLSKGIHTIYIRLRAKIAGDFHCKVEAVPSAFEILQPHYLPDLYDGHLFSNHIALPIANYDSSRWLKGIKLSVTSQSSGIELRINQQEDKNFAIAPGQIRPVNFQLVSDSTRIMDVCGDLSIILKVVASNEERLGSLALRCRRRSQSFIFTFLDHDGSIQHAAAVAPILGCPGNLCPVLLTQHGTTVPPQNQADSYKRMQNGDYVFGSDTAWLLAPTRHGAHNWEGPGALTALSSLEALVKLVEESDWITEKATSHHVIFAGHSMGGHGAWHLATHMPDRALAVVSLAGWLKKEEYGDSNIFFRHDIATTYVDPAVKAILEACIAENEADRLASNLQGLPVLTRIGANDRTIHPFYARRMKRILEEAGVNVTYVELPGKEHWWWDTKETNDGGAVNDQQIRDFTNAHAVLPTATCDSESETCQTEPASLYTEESQSPQTFTYTLVNPAFGETFKGLQILQQDIPFRVSKIEIWILDVQSILTSTHTNMPKFQSVGVKAGVAIMAALTTTDQDFHNSPGLKELNTITWDVSDPEGHITHDTIELKTINVARFKIVETRNRPVGWSSKTIIIDGSFTVRVMVTVEKELCLKKDGGTWMRNESCDGFETDTERGPSNYGPARRVAENKFLIVTGTQGGDVMTQALLEFSVYIANLFFLTDDTMAAVVRDDYLAEETANRYNLIIIGGPEDNSFTNTYLEKVPLSYTENAFSLGGCQFDEPKTGALFTAPHSSGKLALVLMGNTLSALQDIVSLATPTIPPMTRSPFSNLLPDFVITGEDFAAQGMGGYQCTGFWGSSWDLRPELMSCAYCMI